MPTEPCCCILAGSAGAPGGHHSSAGPAGKAPRVADVGHQTPHRDLQPRVSTVGGRWKERELTMTAAAQLRRVFGSKWVIREKKSHVFPQLWKCKPTTSKSVLEFPVTQMWSSYRTCRPTLFFAPRPKFCFGDKNCFENYKVKSEDFS